MNQCYDCKERGLTVLTVLEDSRGEFRVCRPCWKKRQDLDKEIQNERALA
jgi:protein-arginine kinase activator protein McsA